MQAMGFKDRGSSKHCFKNYEDSPDEEEEDDHRQNYSLNEMYSVARTNEGWD